MSKNFREEAIRENSAQQAWREWLSERVATIHSRVTVHDVLRHGGVELQGDGEEQFSCPFHGVDTKPSARVYPENAQSRSHAWCFVCQERWDAITLWKKFHGDDKGFSRVIWEMERAFGITTPEMPTEAKRVQKRVDTRMESFNSLYEASERRLRGAREAYQHLGDLKGYLSAGQVLDRLRYRVNNQKMSSEQGEKILRELLDRIAEKVRSCPVG